MLWEFFTPMKKILWWHHFKNMGFQLTTNTRYSMKVTKPWFNKCMGNQRKQTWERCLTPKTQKSWWGVPRNLERLRLFLLWSRGGVRGCHSPPKILPGPPKFFAWRHAAGVGLFLKVLHRSLTAPLVAKLAPPVAPPNENVWLRPCSEAKTF